MNRILPGKLQRSNYSPNAHYSPCVFRFRNTLQQTPLLGALIAVSMRLVLRFEDLLPFVPITTP